MTITSFVFVITSELQDGSDSGFCGAFIKLTMHPSQSKPEEKAQYKVVLIFLLWSKLRSASLICCG